MIFGEKTVIRPMEIEDCDALWAWWNNGDLMEHAGFPFGLLQSRDAVKKNLLKTIENTDIFSESNRFIICIKENMKPIGEISYRGWDRRNRGVEIGIKICEIHEQEKGYGEDALKHFLNFLFRYLNLERISLDTSVQNVRAQNLYKKLGFKVIGIARKAYYSASINDYLDIVLMDLLREDYYQKFNF